MRSAKCGVSRFRRSSEFGVSSLFALRASHFELRTPNFALRTPHFEPRNPNSKLLVPGSPQMQVEEFENRFVCTNLVRFLGETVPLVVKDNVFYRHAALFNRFDNFV